MVYRARNSLAVRALFLLDDATCLHETAQHAHRNTEVVFLPPDTIFLIHPLDQRYNHHEELLQTAYRLNDEKRRFFQSGNHAPQQVTSL